MQSHYHFTRMVIVRKDVSRLRNKLIKDFVNSLKLNCSHFLFLLGYAYRDIDSHFSFIASKCRE